MGLRVVGKHARAKRCRQIALPAPHDAEHRLIDRIGGCSTAAAATAAAPGMLHGGDQPQHAGQPSGLNSARPLHRQDMAVAQDISGWHRHVKECRTHASSPARARSRSWCLSSRRPLRLGDAFLGMRQLIGGQGAGHVGGLGEGENGGAVLRVAGLVRAGWGSRLNKSRRLCAAAARRGQAQDTPPSTIIRREDPH
jgi:hypothetical protein